MATTRGKCVKWVLVAAALVGVLILAQIREREELQKGPGGAPVRRWATFRPPGGGFSVAMPPSPRPDDAAKTQWGIELKVRGYTASDAGMAFTVAWYDHPDHPAVDWTPEALLQDVRANVLIQQPGADVEEQPVTIGRRTGLKLSIDETNPRRVSRFCLLPAGDRCFILLVSGDPKAWNEPLAERFLNSFRLNQAPPTTKSQLYPPAVKRIRHPGCEHRGRSGRRERRWVTRTAPHRPDGRAGFGRTWSR